jgi:alanine racemase
MCNTLLLFKTFLILGAFVHNHLSVTIDLEALAGNWQFLQRRVGLHRECGAVVKANAYGLGMIEVATKLAQAGCRSFFVANVDEGIALRSVLDESLAAIYVLQGVHGGAENECMEFGLRPVLISLEMIRRWETFIATNHATDKHQPCAVKINTGMNRLGISDAELKLSLAESPTFWRRDVAMLMSHLACADQPEDPLNNLQRHAFEQALQTTLKLNPSVLGSLANSSGLFLGEAYHFNLARPGSALYGINPVPGQANPIRGLVRLALPIIQLREAPLGSRVGYGAETVLSRDSRLAAVAGGYADGIARAAFPRMFGFVKGTKVPLVGRVSMDTLVFDVTEVPHLTLGGEIEILGENISVDEHAQAAGTIGYEVLTSLGARVRRCYLGSVI